MTESFTKAVEEVMVLKQRPTYEDLGEVYALYKQATVGDVTGERPGIFYFKERAKWDVWEEKKGLSKEAAMVAYVELVEKLKEKYGI